MRVTGGVYRGRKVLCPRGDIRPSMDRMRISLFSILGDLCELSFLDLFSGSGIIGIEAASRGARPVVLVEKDPRKRATIQKNISFVDGPIELVTMSVEKFLRIDERGFDIIFIDPPFDFPDKGSVLDSAARNPHLVKGGLLLIHLHRAEKFSVEGPGLEPVDRREYGQSLVMFFRRA
jgi:16S rRNA (guanine966-N2)-methyltransferase